MSGAKLASAGILVEAKETVVKSWKLSSVRGFAYATAEWLNCSPLTEADVSLVLQGRPLERSAKGDLAEEGEAGL